MTDALIERLQTEVDPRARLNLLFGLALDRRHDVVEIALAANADHPSIARVLERVATKRSGQLEACFAELGFGDIEATERGLVADAAYLGWLQLRRSAPAVIDGAGSGLGVSRLLDRLLIETPEGAGRGERTVSRPGVAPRLRDTARRGRPAAGT